MKIWNLFSCVLMITFLLVTARAFAQQTSSPQHRLAIRWNILGLLNLDGIGEIEYQPKAGLGFFVGGGAKSAIVRLGNTNWFEPRRPSTKGWGVYVGANIMLPLGNFRRLSIKPSVNYTRYVGRDYYVIPINGPGFFVSYQINTMDGFVSIAYAQPFAKRFFIEPTLGLGPRFGAWAATPSKFDYQGLSTPIQLNLGVRF